MIPRRVTQTSSSLNSGPGTPTSTAAIQKSSIYDWDNPSSFTGTVKRRPTSGQESDPKSSSSSAYTSNNYNNQKKDTTSLYPKSGGGSSTLPKAFNQGSCEKSKDVEKSRFHTPNKNKPTKSTSNTNNMSCHPASSNDEAQSKHKVKAARQRPQKIETTPGKGARATRGILKKPESQAVNATPNHLISLRSNSSGNILAASPLAHRSHSHNKSYTELFSDFPESYDSMDIIANLSLNTKPLPPPYRSPPEPPPPPPPSSQIPSLNRGHGGTSEERQKFGGKQQRKGLIKGTQQQMGIKDSQPCLQQNESTSHTPGRGCDKRNPHMANESSSASVAVATSNSQSSGINSKQKSPGRGCVSELKNCISRINGRGLFSLGGTCSTSSSSGTKHSDEALNKKSDVTSLKSSNADNNEYSEYEPPIKAKVQDGEDILAKPEFSSSLFKNIPVRPRKGGIPHMENYCLFDPSVDFINEKELKKTDIRDVLELTNTIPIEFPHFNEEELIEEIIYDDHLLKGVDDEDYSSENNYFTIEGDYLDNDDDDGDGDNEVSEETAESADEETENQETQSDNNESRQASNEALHSTPTSNEDENLASSKTSATSSDSQDTEPNDNSTKEKSNFEESEKEKLGQAQSGQPFTAVIRPKPFLNLSPFTTNSLRSSRSATNYAMEKPDLRIRNRTIPIESNYVLFNPGPVPSRVQYKIRKPRPLSTHSDADSGFLSPCSPDELKFNPAILVLEQCDSIQGYIEIYTDWANYYLERAKSKKKVTDLSSDCRDGILLADVIEAVTSFKVPDLVKKPKNQQQMFDNVNSCLTVLRTHSVGGLESVSANDICAGRLKAVLALFFALSRYKQQSKQQKTGITRAETQLQLKHQPAPQQPLHSPQTSVVSSGGAVGNDAMTNRQIPVPYSKTNGGTAIPLPATVLVQRRCPPDKVRPLPPTPNHTPSIPGLAKSGDNGSRPGSPPSNNSSSNHIQAAQKANNNGVRLPPCKIPASPYTAPNPPNGVQQNCVAGSGGATNTGPTKHSMLDKLKLFNKEKSSSSSNNSSAKSQVSKRTSSSSGFSSARSERSDSSLSLNDGHMSQIKPPAVSSNASKKEQNAKPTKQSKLLASSQKATSKETLAIKNSAKQDKKDRSPARKESDVQVGDSKLNSSTGSKGSKLGMTNAKTGEPKTKSTSSKGAPSKLEVRSESKQNLVGSNKSLVTTTTTTSTGIPKPMAAIKGTSKPSSLQDKKQQIHHIQQQDLSNDIKLEKNDISNTNGPMTEHGQEQKMHIVNPMNAVDSSNTSGPIPNGPTNGQHLNKLLQNNNISMSDSLHSSSTQSGIHSNSSESSVIYRPSSESGSDMHYHSSHTKIPPPPAKNPIPNRKIEFDDPMTSGGMRFENGSSGSKKFYTVPSKIVGTIYEEEKPVNVIPMRPLLRGYNSHVTLPTRGTRGQHYVVDFCESDIGQGYCSDGDALRRQPVPRFNDIDNGYLSEGSGGVHGKHFLSLMRARSQLPTTIEERIRSSRGSLDSIGGTSPGSGGSANKMEMNGNANSRRSPSRNGISRDNWSKMPEPVNGHGQSASPTSMRKEKSSPSHSRRNVSSSSSSSKQSSSSSSGRTKGVPQSFGYVKRSNGSATGTITATDQQNILLISQQAGGRTAHVSAVPRSGKMKVSGGTQTCTSDLQTKIPPNTQHRSFSLTGPGATQLSQSIRERLSTGSHSLPKPGTEMHVFQHRISNRGSGKIVDGSLSDTQTYAEVKPEYSSYAMWLKHSNTASSRLSEGDSLENLQIGSPGMTRHGHKLLHRESPYNQSPRLNRSNSIRSTKSEKMYPSMLSRGPDVEIEPYYCLPVGSIPGGANGSNVPVPWSQPTSPTPPNRGFGGPLSPTHAGPPNIPGCHRLTYPKKNDEVHGSAASLLSGGSSLYGSAEERQANEVRRLKRELCDARDQVMSLSSQLSTNAHVVAAFEQSLANMTQRLQQLTATAERKDSELTDMRQTIELLRKQSIQAGLTTAHMQSMGVPSQSEGIMRPNSLHPSQHQLQQQHQQQQHHQQQHQHQQQQHAQQHHTKGVPQTNGGGQVGNNINQIGMQRHHSSDSMCSLNSVSSGCSAQDKKKKKGWLRSSFTKAFSRNAKISKTSRHVSSTSSNLDQQTTQQTNEQQNQQQQQHHQHHQPSSGLPPPSPTKSPQKTVSIIENAKPIDAIELEGNPVVEDLKKQLREKDLVLTDIRLEALSSASQLESLKDTVMKMRAEMISLKQNNERLQKLVTSRSLAGSEASLGNAVSPNGSIGESRRYSLADGGSRPPMELPKSLEEEVEEENIPPAPAPEPPPPPLSPSTHMDLTPPPPAIEVPSPTHLRSVAVEDVPDHTDGKKISIAVYLGQPESFPKYAEELLESDNYYASVKLAGDDDSHENGFEERNLKAFTNPPLNEFVIAYTYISGKTTWQNLDYIVRKTFKDYVSRVDPGTNLGLNTDSITSYHLGEAKRGPEMGFPELLPCGYIIGNVKTLYICLQGVGSLAFDSLIPRSIVHRYISLLTEHRRLILCGPSGTGKSYLARKLAEFLVARSGRSSYAEAIATFNVDHKSSKELRQYLQHIAEQASIANGASELPSVIILDNLHHASALGDVFSSLLSSGPAAKLPCIIGTMSQATCNTTNLQLHHNFRWSENRKNFRSNCSYRHEKRPNGDSYDTESESVGTILTANHMEPVKGFLARFLRRRLFSLELQTHNSQPELANILAWLPTVWQHINRFLENHSSSDVTIGPRLFLSCPLDLKDSQVWFTDVWNYHLAPYLVEAVREGVQLYGRRGGAWNDPSTFIRDTYPWPYGPDSVPPLRQINAEDVGLEGGSTGTNDSQDPLLNMLMRLQEAANYSGNQEQESDCASLDSNITPDSSAGAE